MRSSCEKQVCVVLVWTRKPSWQETSSKQRRIERTQAENCSLIIPTIRILPCEFSRTLSWRHACSAYIKSMCIPHGFSVCDSKFQSWDATAYEIHVKLLEIHWTDVKIGIWNNEPYAGCCGSDKKLPWQREASIKPCISGERDDYNSSEQRATPSRH